MMDLLKLILFFLIYSQILIQECSQDPITISLLTAAVSLMYYLTADNSNVGKTIGKGVKYIGQKIGYFEGCEDYWIPANVDGLEFDLRSNVFGQSFAVDTIINAMRHHLDRRHIPERALMLSFHGPVGTGKNYISKKILNHMFRKGHKTDYVYFFRGSIDFPSNSKINEYKEMIINIVKEKVYECHRSIFVFDEIEKMPPGILDVLSGFVQIGSHGDYDFRRVIFILLSNIGNDLITRATLQSVNNEEREKMNVDYLSKMLAKEAYNVKGGLHQTGLIKNFGISYFVPFLPLERYHVVQCLEREVARLNQIISGELVEQVLEEFTFGPEPVNIFSSSGCKGVAEKAALLIERESYIQRRTNPSIYTDEDIYNLT